MLTTRSDVAVTGWNQHALHNVHVKEEEYQVLEDATSKENFRTHAFAMASRYIIRFETFLYDLVLCDHSVWGGCRILATYGTAHIGGSNFSSDLSNHTLAGAIKRI